MCDGPFRICSYHGNSAESGSVSFIQVELIQNLCEWFERISAKTLKFLVFSKLESWLINLKKSESALIDLLVFGINVLWF